MIGDGRPGNDELGRFGIWGLELGAWGLGFGIWGLKLRRFSTGSPINCIGARRTDGLLVA